MIDDRSKFERDERLNLFQDFLKDARVYPLDLGVKNLRFVLDNSYDYKEKNGYTEHIDRLNPEQPQQIIVPQATEDEKTEFDTRVSAQINEDIEAAERLVENAFKEIFNEQPDLEQDLFDLQG